MSEIATPLGQPSDFGALDPATRAAGAAVELLALLRRTAAAHTVGQGSSGGVEALIGGLGEADMLAGLEQIAVASMAFDALEMRFLVAAERSNVSVRLRGHRLRRWWANHTGTPRAMASERVRVAARLSEWFPLAAQAMDRGELSFAHAARLIRAATPEVLAGLQSIETELLRLASSQTFEQFERDLMMIVDRLNPDGAAPDESLVNQVRITNEFGNTRVSGLLDPVRGEIVANALKQSVETIRSERAQQEQDAQSRRSQQNRQSQQNQQSQRLDHGSSPGEPSQQLGRNHDASGSGGSGSGLTTDPGQRIGALQAEGLVRICQTALSAPDLAGSIPTAHIDVIVRADDPTVATTRNSESIVSQAAMDTMSCNAIYRVIELGVHGAPLRMGRARRLATPDQRRAVFARDGGCVFPGCGAAPRDCDVHHVHRWSDGGATDVENLASLCRFHHSITHSAGWTMHPASATGRASADSQFEWQTPTGALLRSERRIPGAAARLADQAVDEPRASEQQAADEHAVDEQAADQRSPKTPGKLSQERQGTDGRDEPEQPDPTA